MYTYKAYNGSYYGRIPRNIRDCTALKQGYNPEEVISGSYI